MVRKTGDSRSKYVSMVTAKTRVQAERKPAHWLPVVVEEPILPETIPMITLHIQGVTIECPPDFQEASLAKILKVVQDHVR